MNPLEALQMLDQVVGRVSMDRDNHAMAIEAVQVIRRALQQPKDADVETEKEKSEEKIKGDDS